MGTGQRKLSREVKDYNGVLKTTESESYHIAKDKSKGRKGLEEGLRPAFDDEILNFYRDKCIAAFEKHTTRHLHAPSLAKINAGISAYIKSSVSASSALDVLKASILEAYGQDLLTQQYEWSDEGTKQIIKPSYFENIDNYLAVAASELIEPLQLKKYAKLAQTYTRRYLRYFFRKTEPAHPLEDAIMFRGCGNKAYDRARWNAKPDKISVYAELDTLHPYYESHILTSYTVNRNVAEQFMLHEKNTRRLKIEVDFESLLPNIFSSFMVSKDFDLKHAEPQFELLVLPNRNELFVTSRPIGDLYMEFRLSWDKLNL